MLCFYDSVRASLGIINNYSLIAVRICVSLLKSTMDTTLLEKLPKTQKQWLIFFKKVESIVLEMDKKYSKASIKKLLKKVEGGEVSYFRGRECLSSKPNDDLSYQATYQKDGIKIEDAFRGQDEGDIRDRGHFYNASFDNVMLKYHNSFLNSIVIKENIDGIDLIIMIEKYISPFFEFRIELENMLYRGAYNGQAYDVYKINKNAQPYADPLPGNYLLRCYKKEIVMNQVSLWALETIGKTVESVAAENIVRLLKMGYRPIESVEKDEE